MLKNNIPVSLLVLNLVHYESEFQKVIIGIRLTLQHLYEYIMFPCYFC